ncbi:homeobox protein Hox-B5-like [Clytia hemisphaerica]|uniref:Homeobox domain-containing protein n=1 Tax=Clytia hemisphaerica TaxID=252671 RepID=A0A7M5UD27_9CNID
MVDSGFCTFFTKDLDMFDDAKSAVIANLDVPPSNNNNDKQQTKAFNFMNFSLTNPLEDAFMNNRPPLLTTPFHPQQPSSTPPASSTPPITSSSSTTSSDEYTGNKSPKSEVTSLQDEQNSLIEQRIQDRTINLRNTAWPTYPNNRLFNFDLGIGGTGQADLSPIFTNTISSCMVTPPNRNMNWFNRPSSVGTNDSWSNEFSQDPTMRSRPCFSSHQTRELEREFGVCQYVTRRRRIELAYTLSLTEKQIKTWFQNRRVKERKQKKISGEVIEHPDHTQGLLNQTVI